MEAPDGSTFRVDNSAGLYKREGNKQLQKINFAVNTPIAETALIIYANAQQPPLCFPKKKRLICSRLPGAYVLTATSGQFPRPYPRASYTTCRLRKRAAWDGRF